MHRDKSAVLWMDYGIFGKVFETVISLRFFVTRVIISRISWFHLCECDYSIRYLSKLSIPFASSRGICQWYSCREFISYCLYLKATSPVLYISSHHVWFCFKFLSLGKKSITAFNMILNAEANECSKADNKIPTFFNKAAVLFFLWLLSSFSSSVSWI